MFGYLTQAHWVAGKPWHMNIFRMSHAAAGRLFWLALAVLLIRPSGVAAATEESFPLLQIGAHTYTNVTVTTKARDYIFIFHTGGMNSLKVADLPVEVREKLGYGSAEKPKASTNNPAAWAKTEVAKLETPQIKEIRQKLERRWHAGKATGSPLIALIRDRMVLAISAIIVLSYLLHCYCFMLICRKAGHPSGLLVWLPIFQFFPLLRAAGMSGWWVAAYLVPLLNLVTFVLWSVRITKARGKSAWVAVSLILPPTTFLAILYLAFSNGAGARQDREVPEVMSLQAV
jgi:hypothetical protein